MKMQSQLSYIIQCSQTTVGKLFYKFLLCTDSTSDRNNSRQVCSHHQLNTKLELAWVWFYIWFRLPIVQLLKLVEMF